MSTDKDDARAIDGIHRIDLPRRRTPVVMEQQIAVALLVRKPQCAHGSALVVVAKPMRRH